MRLLIKSENRFLLSLYCFLSVFLVSFYSFGQALNCQQWTSAEFDKYIQQKMPKILRYIPDACSVLKEIDSSCPNRKAELSQCLSRMYGYFGQFCNRKGIYSTIMTDSEYFASIPKDAQELPEELQNSSLPKNWREIAKKNGWKYVLFHSGTASTGRLIFYIPGPKYDKLVLYSGMGFPPSSDPTTYGQVQMQSIEKARDGKNLDQAKYFLQGWEFNGPNGKPKHSTYGGSCVACHLNGPRSISPVDQPAFKTELGGVKDINEFNRLVVYNGKLDYSPYYDLQNFPTHLQVGENTNCTDCHNGDKRSSLAFSITTRGNFHEDNIHRKVITESTMPPNEKLTDEERNKIVDYLIPEYKIKLEKWLTETKCTSIEPTKTPMSDQKVQLGTKEEK
jgi:hypothetical protein